MNVAFKVGTGVDSTADEITGTANSVDVVARGCIGTTKPNHANSAGSTGVQTANFALPNRHAAACFAATS